MKNVYVIVYAVCIVRRRYRSATLAFPWVLQSNSLSRKTPGSDNQPTTLRSMYVDCVTHRCKCVLVQDD